MLKSNLISIPLFIAALAICPLFFSTNYALLTLTQMGIAIIFAISYNQLLGKAGLLSLGHAVYFGFGGFFTVHLIARITEGDLYIPALFIPFFGGLAGLFMAALFGSFTTRRGGIMFAMLSFAIAELVLSSTTVLGRYYGGSLDRTRLPPFPFSSLQSDLTIYYLILFWIAVTLIAAKWFNATPLGQMISAAGQNPERVAYVGFSNHRLKYQAFLFSGFLAGIAGALFTLSFEYVTPEIISLKQSWFILQMVFIGGIGYFWGPPIGAILLTLLFTTLGVITDLSGLYIGIMFLAVVLFAPQGITGIAVQFMERLKTGETEFLSFAFWIRCTAILLIAIGGIGLCELFYGLRVESVPHAFMLFSTPLPNLLFFSLLFGSGIDLVRRNTSLSTDG